MILRYLPAILVDVVVAHRHPAMVVCERRVLDHLQRRDDKVDVVGRRARRDAHAVVVQVGRLRAVNLHVGWTNLVDQPQLQLVATAQPEDGGNVLAVIDVRNERLVERR